MNRLIACTSCHRHMRTSEPECPFCHAPLPKGAPTRGTPVGRFGRAAIVVATTAGVAGAVDLAGCSDGPPIMAGDAYGLAMDVKNDYITAADAYGIAPDVIPPFDAGSDAAAADADADATPPDSGADSD